MVSVRRSILYLFLMTLLFPVISLAVVPVSYLDPTFNSPYGYAIQPTPYMLGERPNALAIQSDGKIVVVDTTAEASGEAIIAVTRYNQDGSPDMGFGVNGTSLYGRDENIMSFATDVAIDTNGNIFVAGFRKDVNADDYELVLLRYNSVPVRTLVPLASYQNKYYFDGVNTVASLAIQSDGKIIVATQKLGPSGGKSLFLLRFDQYGSLDTSFGSDHSGVVEYSYYPYEGPSVEGLTDGDNITGRTVKITRDGGKILVLVKVFAYSALLRFDMNGNIDESFKSVPFFGIPRDSEGYYYSGALPRGMDVQPDGRIVVVGETPTYPFVARYNADGNPDSTFGDGSGVVYFNYKEHFGYTDEPIRSGNARSVAVRADGSIFMIGSCPISHTIAGISDDMDIFIARYAADGTLDSSFGVNGVVTFDGSWRDGITYYGDFGEALAVQPDGKVVVVGSIRVYDNPYDPDRENSHNDMVVLRFGDQPYPEAPSIAVSPISYNYGEVEKGKNKVKEFTLSNMGQSDIAITGIDLVGADNVNFSVDPGTCQNLTPIILARESCSLNVSFSPGSEGLKTVILRVLTNNPVARDASGATAEVSLQGAGTSAQVSYYLNVSTDGNGLGVVKSKPKGIKCGTNGTACEAQFSTGTDVLLYPFIDNEESRFVGWSGACGGKKECKLRMDSTKEVKATFMADPSIAVWPQSKDFKDVRLGKMKMAVIVVKNSTRNGKKPLDIFDITLSGGTSSFTKFKDGCSGYTLQPKEACMFGVIFNPVTSGKHEAEVLIPSSDPASQIKVVPLRGRGIAPPPPKPPRKK